MTYSIVGHDPASGQVGVAIATARPAVGARCIMGCGGVAAVATQAITNTTLGYDVLDRRAGGTALAAAMRAALAADPQSHRRQLIAIDATGAADAFTGGEVTGWAGHLLGRSFACAGNRLAGPQVLDAMAAAYRQAPGDLGDRLVAALAAGDEHGGDRLGRESAALLVWGAEARPQIDLRVDHHPDPVAALHLLRDRWRSHWEAYEHTGRFPPADPPGQPATRT